MTFCINNLAQVIKQLDKMPYPKDKPYQVHPISTWQTLRNNTDLCFAQWSDEQLSNYDKETGLIGNKCGVDCYVMSAQLLDILSFNPNKMSLISSETSIG